MAPMGPPGSATAINIDSAFPGPRRVCPVLPPGLVQVLSGQVLSRYPLVQVWAGGRGTQEDFLVGPNFS